MSSRIILTCEWCGREQVKDSCSWSERIVEVTWNVPEDGINGGKFKGELCNPCRGAFLRAVEKTQVEISFARVEREREQKK